MIFALVVALVISTGATYLVYTNIRNRAAAARPQVRKIVVAKAPIDAGASLGAENLALMEWPANVPLVGAFAKTEDVVGRALIYPVAQDEPIRERDLAVAGSGIGLTVKIPEGMRATAVRSNEIVGVAGFLYPGSHVDVLVTYRPDGAVAPVTQTVLQNVEVLTAGQKIEPDPQGRPETVNVVTLLLSPRDSEKMVLAGGQGSVQFVLRNGADRAEVDAAPVDMSELVTGKKKVIAPEVIRAKVIAKAAAKIPPNFYEVETITGDKRSVDKFQ